ncbi:MAG TPA: hypothetical protein VMM79_15875 [Longimicrobiales bacterium]|nr:hypothetical protein [Longimicrobiales bacterium]
MSKRTLSRPNRGITTVVTAILVAMVTVWPLLDLGFDATTPAHIELPDGSSPVHHSAHDHGLCGVMGTVHLMPVEPARIALATRAARVPPRFVPSGLPTALVYAAHRSRAPPSV